jgi:hypothetical protein
MKEIRYESVAENLGNANVSDAITVDKSLKHSAILYWDGTDDSQAKLQLILTKYAQAVKATTYQENMP